MALNLVAYEAKARAAVQAFWRHHDQGRQAQAAWQTDADERGAEMAGKDMDGFIALVRDLVRANGLWEAEVHRGQALVTLPGYFRPTKLWDVVVVHRGWPVAALELKSQVGPLFGDTLARRAEEALGSAHYFQTAYRESALGKRPRPFLGWLMLVEDAPGSRTPVRDPSLRDSALPGFKDTSYIQRSNILCQRLMQDQLYTAACVIAAPRRAVADGQYVELDALTGLGNLVTTFAAHVAAEAARPSHE